MKKLQLLYRHRGLLLLLVCLLTMGTFTGISADSRTVPGDPVRLADPDASSVYAFPQIPLSVPKVPELAPKQQQEQQQQPIEILKITKTSEPESDDTFKFRVKISPKIYWAGECWEPLSVTDEMLSTDSIPESKGIKIFDDYCCNVYIWSAIEHPDNYFYPGLGKFYIQLAYKIIDSTGESDITPYHIIDNDQDFEKSIKFQNADELFNFLYSFDSKIVGDKDYLAQVIKNHYKNNAELDIGYVYFEEEIELKTGQAVAFYILSTPFWVYRDISDLLTVEVEEIESGGYIPDKNPQSEPVDVNISPDTKPVEIKFHNTKPKVTINAEKTWVDFDNKNGIRPDEVTLKILANGQDTNERLTLKAPDWRASSVSLPEIDSDEKTIDYSLEEFVPAGYIPSIAENPANTFTVTNTLETVNISGKKSWSGDTENLRPESVIIRLLGAEEKLVETATVTADDNWEYAFNNLNKFDQHGNKIDYQVIEEPVPNYTRDPQTAGYDITNIYTPDMEDLPVIKIWDDEDNQDGIQPSSVTVQLYADGVPVEGQTLTLDSSNHWEGQFIIPIDGKTYTVQETGAPFDGYNQPVITGSQQEGYTITNTHVPETTSVTVQKVWDDENDRDGKRPQEITVQLFADGEEVPGKRAVLNSDGNWSFTFTDLPKFAIPGKEIRYTISEFPDPDGYETSDPEISVTDNGTFITITNTHEPKKISVKVTKVWEDEENADGSRPDSVTVNLKIGDEIIETLVLSDLNNWTSTFSEMYEYEEGSLIEFTVEEDLVPDGYFSFITGSQEKGFKITNMHTPETVIDIRVMKIWDDQNDKNGLRPESVTVVLRGDNGSMYTAELSASSNWAHTFEKLKKFGSDGIAIFYSLEEVSVPDGYTSSISWNETDAIFVITNRLNEVTPPEPPRFFFFDWIELPKTGITGHPQMKKPASVKYASTSMELFIPGLNVSSDVVKVARQDGTYPVEWLGMDAGLLEGTAIPGEGNSVIAAHNTLNAEEYGPFALLASMEEGDRFFVRNGDDLIIYTVYANEKIGAADVRSLAEIASGYDNTLTLLTCEDELPEGGYASRRIVSGRVIEH